MPVQDGKGLFESARDIPPPDEPINIPDEHYAALGKVADVWADLEFEVDRTIWHLMHTNQALGACVTAQMIGLGPRLRALRALVHLWEISSDIARELGTFEGESMGLAELRNRAIHDKRLMHWKNKEVARVQVTAQRKLVFELVPETITSLDELREKITERFKQFIGIRNKILTELLSSPDKRRAPLPYILDGNSPI